MLRSDKIVGVMYLIPGLTPSRYIFGLDRRAKYCKSSTICLFVITYREGNMLFE